MCYIFLIFWLAVTLPLIFSHKVSLNFLRVIWLIFSNPVFKQKFSLISVAFTHDGKEESLMTPIWNYFDYKITSFTTWNSILYVVFTCAIAYCTYYIHMQFCGISKLLSRKWFLYLHVAAREIQKSTISLCHCHLN